jgi:RimJ/RimL family protein N-acetyltransferase
MLCALHERWIQRLISIIEAENIASIRAAEECGMSYEKDSVFHGEAVRIYAMKDIR